MKIEAGNTLYVRRDIKIGEDVASEQDAMDSMAYLQEIAKERYLVAGLFGNMELEEIDGAMILFEARDQAEAEAITNEDPIIQRGFYRYELCAWHVMLSSD